MTRWGDSTARIAMSWLIAAKDLGIAVEIKNDWHCSAGAEHASVYIRDFGGPHGTCACPMDCYRTGRRHGQTDRKILEEHVGCYVSFLSSSYATYDRDNFAATLDDWQWFAQGMPPTWYTGRPWGH